MPITVKVTFKSFDYFVQNDPKELILIWVVLPQVAKRKQRMKEAKGSCTLAIFLQKCLQQPQLLQIYKGYFVWQNTRITYLSLSYITQGSHEVNKSKLDETDYSLFTKMPRTVKVTFKSFDYFVQNDPKELILIWVVLPQVAKRKQRMKKTEERPMYIGNFLQKCLQQRQSLYILVHTSNA